MNKEKKEYLDYLYYEIGKQSCNFELTILTKDGAKSKWRTYLDIQADNNFIEKANNRTILDIEIVLDVDLKENESQEQIKNRFHQLLSQLNSDELSYQAYFTGSKGYHIHLIFGELKDLNKIDREKLKEFIIKKYDCDLMKKSERCMIALEHTAHYKTGNPKELVKGINGTNDLKPILKEFKEFHKKIEQKKGIFEKKSLAEVKQIFHSWIHYADEDIIDIVYACAIGERIDGDPIWLFLIAPPGGTKTELLRSLEDGNLFYHLSDLTSKTFVSGLMLGKGEERRKIEDLLPQLNKKTVLFKDFTTVLEKNKDERREIMAQLREIYDGFYSKKFGTIDKKVSYKSRFGFIAGVTPIIDQHWKVMQQLGERFLKLRWMEDRDKTTEGAYSNEGKEVQMRQEILEATMGFLCNINLDYEPKFDDSKYKDKIMKLAKLVAIARTPVTIQDSRSDFYYDFEPMPEQPTRLVKQFKKLIKTLALIHQKKEVGDEEIRLAYRVGCDTIPQDRLKILCLIRENQGVHWNGCTKGIIENSMNLPDSSIYKVLQQLKLLELIEETKEQENGVTVSYFKVKKWVKEIPLYPLTSTKQVRKNQGIEHNKAVNEEIEEEQIACR